MREQGWYWVRVIKTEFHGNMGPWIVALGGGEESTPLPPEGEGEFYICGMEHPYLEKELVIGPRIEEPKEMKWQPIETAPMDYRSILVHAEGRDGVTAVFHVCRFSPDDWFAYTQDSREMMVDFLWYPTHWMPLPSPPEDDNG